VEETGALPPFCTKQREPGTVRKLKMSFTRIYQPLNVHWTDVHAIRDFVTHLPGRCVTKSPKEWHSVLGPAGQLGLEARFLPDQ
jgi:hypothetical protein